MTYCIILISLFFSVALSAQSGFKTWTYLQKEESHLKADYKEKKVYESPTGNPNDAELRQTRVFENGRLKKDIVYQPNSKQALFDITLRYKEDGTALAFNAIDSAEATYSFTKDGKIRYYVVDRNSKLHIVYTYDNKKKQLVKCKDCLNPLDDHNWCVYYRYYYNEKGSLLKVENYNLEANKPVDEKILISYDSLEYNTAGLLIKKISFNPAQNAIAQTDYTYNKKGLLVNEYSTQLGAYLEPQSYTKKYKYFCNKNLKQKEERFFKKRLFTAKAITKYNKKGLELKRELYDVNDKIKRMHKVEYSY